MSCAGEVGVVPGLTAGLYWRRSLVQIYKDQAVVRISSNALTNVCNLAINIIPLSEKAFSMVWSTTIFLTVGAVVTITQNNLSMAKQRRLLL